MKAFANRRYRLVAELGEGGFATVYRALDTLLEVERAVKVLEPPRRGDMSEARHRVRRERRRRRFLTEARAMARINHPHILRVYDFGHEGDVDYVVMELAEAGSLGERVRRSGALQLDYAVRYGVQVLSGLSAAHAAGIIHRDVKPHNILLSRAGRAMLGDFGVALLVDDPVRHTQDGATVGTLAFMAPEQKQDAHAVGPRADVYGMAATLYQLLTRQTPADLTWVEDDSPRWLLIDPAVRPVLQRALRPRAEQRHATAQELADALMVAAGMRPEDVFPRALDPTLSDDGDKLVGSLDQPTVVLPDDSDLSAIDDLRKMYRASLSVHLDSLVSCLASIDEPGSREAARRLAHSLRGSGGSYGFFALTETAGRAEDAPEGELRDAVERLVRVVRETVRAGEGTAAVRRVLVIDRDPSQEARIRQAVGDRSVAWASTALEARRLAAEGPVALVVLDLQLPDMDGRELLVQLRKEEHTARAPVVVLTRVLGPMTRSECFALGADEYLTKPIGDHELQAVVRALLEPRPGADRAPTGLLPRMDFRRAMGRAREAATTVGRPYCVALVRVRDLDRVRTQDGEPGVSNVLRVVGMALRNSLRRGVAVTEWEPGVFAVLLPEVDATGGELELNVALAEFQSFYATDEARSVTLAAGVVEPKRSLTPDALHVAQRMSLLASQVGPGQVVATTCDVQDAQHIAMAEDDPTIATMVARLLQAEGVTVRHFASGDLLLERLDQLEPAAFLLDVHMPGSSGFEVLHRIRAESRFDDTPVVMLTSVGQESSVVLGFDLGADDWILKPLVASEFTARVRRLLRRSRGKR